MEIRSDLRETDQPAIRQLLDESGFFYPFETEVVMDIFEETLLKGSEASGYYWCLLEEGGKLAGFANFGPNPVTLHSWDLYWLAVRENLKKSGLGTRLLTRTEETARLKGGKILWVETSGRALYQPTVAFYHRRGYTLEATLPEYYGPADPKLIFRKSLT
ncbi:MAG TPA: GNAT family N-acetyltransferase [Prolixibacteraceae bacterium]|nr:GNAT family N-acetyltransferase [Prolixibacteraceae bacterium]HRV87885.1 GNAT family N-acetyltransferase [Prolixibacteraceae bacterium]